MQPDRAARRGCAQDDDPFLLLRAFLVLAVGLAFLLSAMEASREMRIKSRAELRPPAEVGLSLRASAPGTVTR